MGAHSLRYPKPCLCTLIFPDDQLSQASTNGQLAKFAYTGGGDRTGGTPCLMLCELLLAQLSFKSAPRINQTQLLLNLYTDTTTALLILPWMIPLNTHQTYCHNWNSQRPILMLNSQFLHAHWTYPGGVNPGLLFQLVTQKCSLLKQQVYSTKTRTTELTDMG